MPFKSATSHHNRSIIKTKVSVPRNSIIKNNPVIQGDKGSQSSVNQKENNEKQKLEFRGRKNGFKKIFKFLLKFQGVEFRQK